MSFFPPPKAVIEDGYIFNSADFIGNNDSQAEGSSTQGSSSELSHNYLPLSGGTLTGTLLAPSVLIYNSGALEFSDQTLQTTAFTAAIGTTISDLVTDVAEIDTRLIAQETKTTNMTFLPTTNTTVVSGEIDVPIINVGNCIKFDDPLTTVITNCATINKSFTIDPQGVSTFVKLTPRNTAGNPINFLFSASSLNTGGANITGALNISCTNDISLNGYPSLKTALDNLSTNSSSVSNVALAVKTIEEEVLEGSNNNAIAWQYGATGTTSQTANMLNHLGILRLQVQTNSRIMWPLRTNTTF